MKDTDGDSLILSDEQIEALRAEHGEITALEYHGRSIVLRKCTPAEYKRFRATAMNDQKRDMAVEYLVRDTMVHPPKAEQRALFEEFPALAEAIVEHATKLAGIVTAEIRK